MATTTSSVEGVTLNDVLGLATWQRERSSDELRAFVSRREATIDVADFDFNE